MLTNFLYSCCCPKCGDRMPGIFQEGIRDACHECGGNSLIADTPERQAIRARRSREEERRRLPRFVIGAKSGDAA